MKRSKILYVITGLVAGGAEIMLKRIVSKLNKNRFEIILCSITKTLDLYNDLKLYIKKIYCINVKKQTDFFNAVIKLRKIILKEKPEIIHCFMPHANILGRISAIGLGIRVISSLWVVLLEKKYLNYLDSITQFLVDIYTVNSNALKEYVKKFHINSKKIYVVESGLDFSEFKPMNNCDDLKSKLKLSNNPILTMVAHLRKQKDYPTMLKAIEIINKELQINFLICGYGHPFEDETRRIKHIIKDLDLKNVKMLGFRKDIQKILAITDIWVSSTLYEGQSNSLLEAMAMKKPIITTNIPENAEVVRHKQEAILVPIKSPKKIAEAVILLLKNKILATSLAENAYKRVRKKYNIMNTVKKLELIYTHLIC
ncbi:MAG: glycosyltransferase [Candidatus Helarchaeota archaeon]